MASKKNKSAGASTKSGRKPGVGSQISQKKALPKQRRKSTNAAAPESTQDSQYKDVGDQVSPYPSEISDSRRNASATDKPRKGTRTKRDAEMHDEGLEEDEDAEETPQTGNTEVWHEGEETDVKALTTGLPPAFEPLTPQQRLFVIFYSITRKGVEAARMAGYGGDYNALAAASSRMLRNVNILQAYDAYMHPVFEQHGATVSRTIQHLADLAYAPWGDYVIVKEKKGRIVQVFMPLGAKVKALEILSKMMRLIGDKSEDNGANIHNAVHFHLKDYKTANEVRQALLTFLKNRK